MIQALTRNSSLLALCGIFDTIFCATSLLVQCSGESLSLRTFVHYRNTLVVLGTLALAAEVCAIVAGIWNLGKSKFWPLLVNGLAGSALGLIFIFRTGPLAFRIVALLIVVMSMSIGVYEFASAQSLRSKYCGQVAPCDSWGALGWLRFSVYRLRVWLDQTGSRITHSNFTLDRLLLWFHCHLDGGSIPIVLA
ncbi:MAG: hypothetical protein M3O31_06585 [Acidobacteriota bacterium]|nr:hypothetical protein [Acidobacteriota bacterium]